MAQYQGGYIILPLEGTNFTIGTGVTIPGIYERLEGSTKPALVENFSIGGVEQRSAFVSFILSGGTYTGYVGVTQSITVTAEDVVTINAVS